MSAPDLTGQKFGRLTVVEPVKSPYHAGGGNSRLWLCACECGRRREVRGDFLRDGRVKSCGCLLLEVVERRRRFKGHIMPLGGPRTQAWFRKRRAA